MTRETYALIEQYMLHCMQDAAHDPNHIYRVLYAAIDIAGAEPTADMDIVIAAALLHDIGREKQAVDPSLDHAAVGAPMALAYLRSIGWPDDRANHVADCVRTHRFRSGDAPSTIEASIIFDADKLDVTGAMGVARTLCYGGQVNEPIFVLDDEGKLLTTGGGAEISSFVQEFNWKLRHIYDKFLTVRGAQLAAARKDVAIRFADALENEIRQVHEDGPLHLRDVLTQ